MKDIPYSTLKQDERAYEIMLLRDQHGNTFADLAKGYKISTARTIQIYNRIKLRQGRMYINHISCVLGHENTEEVGTVFAGAYECYQDLAYACSYLEKKYHDILMPYRDGEPGAPARFLKTMPPFKPRLSKKTVARVVEMREAEKASFAAIGKELRITRAKAKSTYDSFYHKKVLAIVETRQKKAASSKEKAAILIHCFERRQSAKKRYDMLMKEQSVQE